MKYFLEIADKKSVPSKSALMLMMMCTVLACSKKDFSPAPVEAAPQEVFTDFSQEAFFSYSPIKDFFQQDQYDRNETSISFQVINSRGQSVQGLGVSDVEVLENNRLVQQFDLSSQSVNLGQKADIVFVIDVTSSMQPTINSVKTKVREFVEKMQRNKVQALLCLVTFRDKTEKKCESIVEDNPATPQNENLDRFLEEVSQLRASSGGDTDENQLRAVIDAAATPWRTGSQRLAILITDAGFHYQPDNKGNAGKEAPYFTEAVTAVQNSRMTLFAVAPNKEGYSAPFQGNPSLVDVSQGQHFNYSAMVSGQVGMETIFQTIVDRVSTRYLAKYVIEDNLNLDPTEPIHLKRFQVRVVGHPEYTVQILGSASTQPNGHPEFRKRFFLSRKPRVNSKNFAVKVNGVDWSGARRIDGSDVVLDPAPPAGSHVEVTYDSVSLRDGLKVQALVLPQNLDVNTLTVIYNGRKVSMESLKLSRDVNGNLILDPAFTVYSVDDPYKVVDQRGLRILVEGSIVTLSH